MLCIVYLNYLIAIVFSLLKINDLLLLLLLLFSDTDCSDLLANEELNSRPQSTQFFEMMSEGTGQETGTRGTRDSTPVPKCCTITSLLSKFMDKFIAIPFTKGRYIVLVLYLVITAASIGVVTHLKTASGRPEIFAKDSNIQRLMSLRSNLSAESIDCNSCSGVLAEVYPGSSTHSYNEDNLNRVKRFVRRSVDDGKLGKNETDYESEKQGVLATTIASLMANAALLDTATLGGLATDSLGKNKTKGENHGVLGTTIASNTTSVNRLAVIGKSLSKNENKSVDNFTATTTVSSLKRSNVLGSTGKKMESTNNATITHEYETASTTNVTKPAGTFNETGTSVGQTTAGTSNAGTSLKPTTAAPTTGSETIPQTMHEHTTESAGDASTTLSTFGSKATTGTRKETVARKTRQGVCRSH